MQKSLRKLQSLHSRRRNTSRTLVTLRKKCERSMKKMTKGRCASRHVFGLCLKSRASVEGKQTIWKKKPRPCRQERKDEAAVRHSPMDVALPWWSTSSQWEQHRLCSSSPSFREKSAGYMAGNISKSQHVAGGEERRVGRRLGQGEGGKWMV